MLAILSFRLLPGQKPIHVPWPFQCKSVRNEELEEDDGNFAVFYQKPIAFFPKKWIKRIQKNFDEESNFPVFYQKPIAFFPRKCVKRVQKNSIPTFLLTSSRLTSANLNPMKPHSVTPKFIIHRYK